MSKRDYYSVLGVGRDATEAEIKASYRKAARTYHPDVNKDPAAGAKFREATEAYEVLSDAKKRQMYDQFGHVAPGTSATGPRARSAHAPGEGFHVSFEEIFGAAREGGSGFMGMGLEEILSSLRGKRRGAKPRRSRKPESADVEHALTLDFMQAVWGMTAPVRIRRGDGADSKTETINVKIPPGIGDGSRVRVRGKGAEGPGGQGDLYITCHVRPHPYFDRRGDDIYVEVPISITEAALGAKVDVPTLDGMTSVTIPPGTDGSKRLRLRAKGIRASGGTSRGDQYVVLRIAPPTQLSDRGRELLKEFEREEPFDPRGAAPWK
jgi:curved DNA-binding protein